MQNCSGHDLTGYSHAAAYNWLSCRKHAARYNWPSYRTVSCQAFDTSWMLTPRSISDWPDHLLDILTNLGVDRDVIKALL